MILVTGATGLVGRYTVPALLKAGYQVRCMVRNLKKAQNLLGNKPEYCTGDVIDSVSLELACQGINAVIHLVAIIREKGKVTFEQINAQGTLNVIKAAEKAGCERFIHMSALGVKKDPSYRYAYSKWQGEQAVQQSKLAWTIFRPSVIYGRGFGFFDRMTQSIKLSPPPFVVFPLSKTLFQPLAAVDLARCVVLSLEKPETIGKIYEIGGPEHLTYKQMLDIFLTKKGIKRIKLPVPLSFLQLVVPVMERIFKDPPVTSIELKQMKVNNITDLDSARKYFGFTPRFLGEGLDISK